MAPRPRLRPRPRPSPRKRPDHPPTASWRTAGPPPRPVAPPVTPTRQQPLHPTPSRHRTHEDALEVAPEDPRAARGRDVAHRPLEGTPAPAADLPVGSARRFGGRFPPLRARDARDPEPVLRLPPRQSGQEPVPPT